MMPTHNRKGDLKLCGSVYQMLEFDKFDAICYKISALLFSYKRIKNQCHFHSTALFNVNKVTLNC